RGVGQVRHHVRVGPVLQRVGGLGGGDGGDVAETGARGRGLAAVDVERDGDGGQDGQDQDGRQQLHQGEAAARSPLQALHSVSPPGGRDRAATPVRRPSGPL